MDKVSLEKYCSVPALLRLICETLQLKALPVSDNPLLLTSPTIKIEFSHT